MQSETTTEVREEPQLPVTVETGSRDVIETIKKTDVTDPESYRSVADAVARAKGLIEQLNILFRPVWDSRRAAMNKVRERWDGHVDPLTEALNDGKDKQIAFDEQEEKRRREEQIRREQEERKRAETDQLALAEAAEKAGAKDLAEEILEEPPPTRPVFVPKATPKVSGQSTRETWSAECTNLQAMLEGYKAGKIPWQAFKANEPVVNQNARTYHTELEKMWPGIKVHRKTVLATKAK